MTLSEIIAELPKLSPDELEAVLECALELRKDTIYEASPELLKAIEEAERETDEHDISIEEAYRVVESWPSHADKAPNQSS
jgi:hypothetical protein